jgi:hypothetical protein
LRDFGRRVFCVQTVYARRNQNAAAGLFHQSGRSRRQQADGAFVSKYQLLAGGKPTAIINAPTNLCGGLSAVINSHNASATYAK